MTRHLERAKFRSDWLVFSGCDWPILSVTVSFSRSLGGPLSHGSRVVFLDLGRPCLWNFYSTITVYVVRMKSEMNVSLTLHVHKRGQSLLNTTCIFFNALF